jgi:hypothetical protein
METAIVQHYFLTADNIVVHVQKKYVYRHDESHNSDIPECDVVYKPVS